MPKTLIVGSTKQEYEIQQPRTQHMVCICIRKRIVLINSIIFQMNTSLVSYVNTKKLKLAKEKADRDAFLKVVNQNPPQKWVKEHPISKVKYIPIEIIENTLTQLFQEWNVEVKNVQQILNSIAVTVRLHYRDPLTGEMRYQDGVGAMPVQADKGSVLSIGTVKANAIQIGLPAAKSFAIKDAVEHIGKLFGRDIGRVNALDFIPRYSNADGTPRNTEDERIRSFIGMAKNAQELTQISEQLISEGVYTQEYQDLVKTRENELQLTNSI